MRNMLGTIYKDAYNRKCEGVNGQLSDLIPTRNGARQGCSLSLLLSLFISVILKLLNEGGFTGVTLGTLKKPYCLLSDYSGKFGLQVNESKQK